MNLSMGYSHYGPTDTVSKEYVKRKRLHTEAPVCRRQCEVMFKAQGSVVALQTRGRPAFSSERVLDE
jgi:hypothetical protein